MLLLAEGRAVRVVLGVSWASGAMSAPDMDITKRLGLVGWRGVLRSKRLFDRSSSL